MKTLIERNKIAALAIITSATIFIAILIYIIFLSNPVVAKVGTYEIRKNDVSIKNKINKIFYPLAKEDYGLQQLVKAYTYAQIFANNGRVISEQMVRHEEVRIDTSTRAPETLQKIKDLFHGDMDLYRKVFVLPTLVESRLPAFYSQSTQLAAESLASAQTFLQKVKQNTKDFSGLAKNEKYETVEIIVSQNDGVYFYNPNEKATDQLKRAPPTSTPQSLINKFYSQNQDPRGDKQLYPLWLSEIKNLKPGQIVPTVLNFQDVWIVASVHSVKSKNEFILTAAKIPKTTFSDWIEQETKKIKIEM